MNAKAKHIILGAGGAIGNVLAEELISKGEQVKLVSRSGKIYNGAETERADLTKYDEVKSVVEDSAIVYLTAGLQYDIKIWRTEWPKIMRNTINACKGHNAKLIFFDNVYSYGKVEGKMTEETPVNPCSKKGELRAQIADELLSEMKAGNITACIAKAADFYGPYSEKSSIPYILVIDNLLKGKKPQWMADAKTKHSFTYTLDCGKALHMLSITDDAFSQVWHLPTAHPPISGEDFIKLVAEQMGKKPDYALLRGWMIKAVGLFNKQISELYEMLYQNKYDYYFDSTKFEKSFSFTPTPYTKGIADTVKAVK